MMTFLRQLRGELKKLFSRKRTYIGYVVFLVFEAILLTLWVKIGRGQFQELAERNFIPVELLSSSLTASNCIMGFSMILLGSIYFALVAGDIVAKETEDGNLRWYWPDRFRVSESLAEILRGVDLHRSS